MGAFFTSFRFYYYLSTINTIGMKSLYIITGTSSGIGKALAQQLLEFEDNFVLGIARRTAVNHERYQHVTLDLSDLTAVSNFQFPKVDEYSKVVLINNAGYLGEVKRQGTASTPSIIDTYSINLVAPVVLCNAFLKHYQSHENVEKVILNVSSGAGKRPIDAWAPYCSTKSGLDLYTETLAEELALQQSSTRVFSIAPGIVDTEMQAHIRASNSEDFSKKDDFVGFKENGELSSPDEVARKYRQILNRPSDFKEAVFSLRDLN